MRTTVLRSRSEREHFASPAFSVIFSKPQNHRSLPQKLLHIKHIVEIMVDYQHNSSVYETPKRTGSAGPLISVSLVDVPEYLHHSGLYQTLVQNVSGQQEEFMVSFDCFKRDDAVSNLSDLRHLLNTLRYWMIDQVPDSVHHFIFDHQLMQEDWIEVLQDFDEAFLSLGVLPKLFGKSDDQWLAEAARNGALSLMQYLRRRGSRWMGTECSNAAGGGHLECLQYAHENGCALGLRTIASFPYQECACMCAFRSDSLACLQYAHEYDCHRVHKNYSITASLCTHTTRPCLEYVLDHNFRVDRLMEVAIRCGSISGINKLLTMGEYWQRGMIATAIRISRDPSVIAHLL